jgi:hypothetical protein
MKPDQKINEMLKAVSATLSASRIDLVTIKASVLSLLEYLASPKGRTDENCKAVDSFFGLDDSWPEKELPDDFHDLLADMGSVLHDAISAPEIAENFDSTPEQLLERARKLNTEQRVPC